MAISREKGVELTRVFPKSVNKQKFKMFLDELRSVNQFEDVILMMDNLNLHKSNDVK